jgi:transcriptional regulator with XRE-family HTH domain
MPSVPNPGPSLRSQWLGEKLRDLRNSKKLPLKSVGEYLQRDASTISRYENGEFPLRLIDLQALLSLYGVSDPKQREGLEQICKDSWQKGWWDQHREDLGDDFINLPWLESRADRICAYQVMVVHGLLQTREYAEALIRNVEERKASEDQIERWVNLRMDRQRVLAEEDMTEFAVILEEYVLDRPIGGTSVWRSQLEHLLAEGERDSIEIRIMPVDRAPHAGHQGTFTLFELPEPYTPVAYIDTLGGPLFVEDPTVQRFSDVWNDLESQALSPKRSRQMIANRLKEI